MAIVTVCFCPTGKTLLSPGDVIPLASSLSELSFSVGRESGAMSVFRIMNSCLCAGPVFSMLNVTAPALALFTLVVIDHSASVTSTVPDEGPVGTVSVLSEAAFPPESSSRDAADGVFARPVADAMPIAEPVTAIATTMPAHPRRRLRFFNSTSLLESHSRIVHSADSGSAKVLIRGGLPTYMTGFVRLRYHQV